MSLKNKCVLITGGAGFIGSHIVGSLLEKCENIIVYDNFSTGTKENLVNFTQNKNLKIVKADILDYKTLKKYVSEVDIVSHHAAELEVFTGIFDMHHDMKVNIEGTLNVLKASMDSNVKKVIFASSGALYGQAQHIPENEEHPLNPHWPYGVSKLAGEKYCTVAYNLYGLPTVSLRYGIVYGPREWYGRVLTLFIKRCINRDPPIIFGDGMQTRDFVYVSDIVDAHNSAIDKNNADGKSFNVGSGTGTSVKELAKLVIELSGTKVKPIFDDPPEGKESKYQRGRKRLVGELKEFIYDIRYAGEILQYRPKVDIRTGIKREINWVRQNPHRWTKIRV